MENAKNENRGKSKMLIPFFIVFLLITIYMVYNGLVYNEYYFLALFCLLMIFVSYYLNKKLIKGEEIKEEEENE